MKMEPNYQTASVNEPNKVLQFLSHHLTFSDHGELQKRYIDKQGVIVGNRFGNNYVLVPGRSMISINQGTGQPIIVNTDDCLRDYHQLQGIGVKIEQTLRYSTRGLEFIISDSYDNRYLLLEKRDYSEL
jgi:hypothetical protein